MNKETLRKKLIKLLDDAIVPYDKWNNRDTPSAQEACGIMRMYLKAGCDFKLVWDYELREIADKEIEEKINSDGSMFLAIFHYEFEDS